MGDVVVDERYGSLSATNTLGCSRAACGLLSCVMPNEGTSPIRAIIEELAVDKKPERSTLSRSKVMTALPILMSTRSECEISMCLAVWMDMIAFFLGTIRFRSCIKYSPCWTFLLIRLVL